MLRTLLLITLILFINGCSTFSFKPVDSAPQTEHDKLVKAQQDALREQQQSALDNYRL